MKKLLLYLLLLVGFACSKPNQQLTKITGKRLSIDTTLASDAAIEEYITPFREELQNVMKKPLCTAPVDLIKTEVNLQSTLGNLFADLSYEMANPVFQKLKNTNIDFCLMNSGGLRANISKGTVRTENAFFVMPFENELVVTKLSGAKVKELFDYFVDRRRAHPISKQVELNISGDDYTAKIGGKPFDINGTYYVLTNDYLQTGGSGMTFFANPIELTNLDYLARDAMLDYLKKVDVLTAKIDNRVTVTP
ncbi:MAG: UDP-sugar hydrolase [Flavobacteriaceae bacterium]|nr:UDP-sugar hydrolase [Flavobacteriaceae bacterium]|tara:strand:+ start:10456 stop:11205 length:750 start_codon:yes stop_codon:yes gene_type:complete